MRFPVLSLLLMLVLSSPAGLGEGLLDIHSPNGVDVWAVGHEGLVFHSLDSGDEWYTLTLGTADLRSVAAVGTRVWIAGDGGALFVSSDNGGSWSSDILAGGKDLTALSFLDLDTGVAVGDSGTVLLTSDGGMTWDLLPSTGTTRLYDVVMVDPGTMVVVGGAGTALSSGDGGQTWNDISEPEWTSDIYSVEAVEGVLVIGGQDGFSRVSSDGGASWTQTDVRTDSRSDIRDIHALSQDHFFLVGGGGFVRETTDGGLTGSYKIHPLHARTVGVFFYDEMHGWVCTDRNNAVLRTSDGGVTWDLPAGTTVSYAWTQRLTSTSSIGNTFAINPKNKEYIYVALGRFIYMSPDRGETWTETSTISSSSGSTHSFYISSEDTNMYVAAYTGGGDHIRKSFDRGQTWTETIQVNFSAFGMPLEQDGSHPDTLLFGPENGLLYRSIDFGSTWFPVSNPGFSSPCDLAVVRDSSNVIWVGDSGPGRISRSTDGGVTFTLVRDVGSAEIPTIAHGNLSNGIGFATAWSSGGLQRTTDFGANWSPVSGASSTWGVDVSNDDPNVVMFGVYGGGLSYLSTDGGATFRTTSLSGSNYAILCYDRETFLAQQSGGVWKMVIDYTVPTTNAQALVLLSPNGGEQWEVGQEEEIRWTSSNVGTVDLEYTTDGGTVWEAIATGVSASSGVYAWLIPNTPVESALVRVMDGDDGTPEDESDEAFSITVATVSVDPEELDFGEVLIGTGRMDTVRITNSGTATLVVTSAVTGSSVFTPGRTSFTIGAGESDTLSVWFMPVAQASYRDTLVLSSNASGGDQLVILTGDGSMTVDVTDDESLIPREYVLDQNYPNPFNPMTEIRYGLPSEGHVVLRVYSMLGEEVRTLVNEVKQAGWHSVRFPAGDLASGMYLYRLEAGQFVSTKKMLLLK